MKAHITSAISLIASLVIANALGTDPMKPIDPADYKKPVKVSCVGDSITFGSFAGEGNSYPTQLQQMLGDKWKVSNFGLSGRTLLKKGDRPYWRGKDFQKALDSEPDVVIIMLGTNDSKPQNWEHKEEFEADYREFVESFKKLRSRPRIYICRTCPVPGGMNKKESIREAPVLEQIVIIDKLAKKMKLGLIDMYAALKDFPELLPDHVHPNKEGARKLAEAAFTALTGKPATEAEPAEAE